MSQEEAIKDLASKYQSGQNHTELAWFWEACKGLNPKVVVEIGVFAGGTLKVLSTLVDDDNGLVVGIDNDWHNWRNHCKWNLNSGNCPIKLIDGSSHEQSTKDQLIKELDGRLIDVLFIDGDHTYDGCDMDFKMYSPLVRQGGIIGVHDLTMKRQPQEPLADKKCGEWWDELPGPKQEKICDNTSCGIGYIIKNK